MNLRINVSTEKLDAFCTRWQIIELALFGSVLRDDFGPRSDVDVLVRFESNVLHLHHIQKSMTDVGLKPY